ncbi:unnamed protein product [Microthlaspi erraticum]|uniref:Endonuclease/exonuclease/phosphatase domain-containing protein n=1 Tax=Microthlaspi erraticum TaxID=1685480 RepID=A0A6D2J2M3_9BRAS|nr:unnamed protein product [Microthlaspi erraticum]
MCYKVDSSRGSTVQRTQVMRSKFGLPPCLSRGWSAFRLMSRGSMLLKVGQFHTLQNKRSLIMLVFEHLLAFLIPLNGLRHVIDELIHSPLLYFFIILKWQEAKVTHLPFLASDHAPLYVQLSPTVRGNAKRRPFRFEAAWLKHEGFQQLLTASWRGERSTPQALDSLRMTLKKWNREVFGDVQRRKEKLLSEIQHVQDSLENNQSDSLLAREERLLKEFDVILEQEELIWFQKSREKYIALGDRNTSYFHTSTVIRRRRNRIEMLRNDEEI